MLAQQLASQQAQSTNVYGGLNGNWGTGLAGSHTHVTDTYDTLRRQYDTLQAQLEKPNVEENQLYLTQNRADEFLTYLISGTGALKSVLETIRSAVFGDKLFEAMIGWWCREQNVKTPAMRRVGNGWLFEFDGLSSMTMFKLAQP